MSGYHFGCPHCRARLEVSDASRAGRTVNCPKCSQALLIPPPPPMGVPLSQPVSRTAPRSEPTEIRVSQEPGFKRPLSPAKAFTDMEAPPPPAASYGLERLPDADFIDSPGQHTISANDEVEGYSLTIPEKGEAIPPPVRTPKKKRNTEAEELPHPWEDPKRQLLALILVVTVVGGIATWIRRSRANVENEESTPSSVPSSVPESSPQRTQAGPTAPTSELPGGGAGPDLSTESVPRTGLPGASMSESTMPEADPQTVPAAPPVTPAAASDPNTGSNTSSSPTPASSTPATGLPGGLPGAAAPAGPMESGPMETDEPMSSENATPNE